jgi:hypothetical protein
LICRPGDLRKVIDALVFDVKFTLDIEAMPLSRIIYWFDRAYERANRKKSS